ncbi:asparagine synthase (glutamine-hydrolysing) [Allochromatium warmingii]|uniref:asparagine synthase (glutamine-hydrolyzing) n=1 Tax=Allochromatium warmingii TaxID=61595 RepID=A0A1H3AM18_ALLWA|nr:asparagine synthase (glutamine-hydrolyzing) [Allochromatium warmingii]SDX29879.1 asparagine synthase (glutamine-hydrolysing) [Allochromatium warmingii]
MCGIAGFICAHGQRPEPDLLDRLAERLAHRGPDDRGRYIAGPVGLVQTRLSIIGLDSGHQPLLSPDGQHALVANGEVYNYIELNATLRDLGYPPHTGSDSETILNAYAAHGLAALPQLRGMYAFALHDVQRGELLLGRDRLGIKPLFYIRLADRIAFASEIKALLAILPHSPQLVPSAVRQFLQQQFASGEDTVLDGIQRVPPGTVLRINAELQIRPHRYWSALAVAPRQLGIEAAAAELDARLDDALREHQRADVPFGLFLSGGLDSAVLAAKLAEQGAGRIKSYSVGYRGTRLATELAAAARVAAHFGFDHQPLELDGAQVFGRLPHTIWCADELMRDYACLPTSILAETASADLKVVFSGEGGDEVFAGYGRYRPPLAERLLKSLLHPGSGGFRTHGQWSGYWTRRLFGPALRAVAATERAPFQRAWRETPPHWSAMQRRQYTDLVTALPDNLLVKTDRLLMGFGLEGRVPLLDHRIVEFGLALPDALKVRQQQGKWLMRRWAEPKLPPGHLAQPKRGFHVPVSEWLRGPLAADIGQRLLRHPGLRDWFEIAAIPELVTACQSGRGGVRELFGLMQFAIWHRLFIEQLGVQPAPDERVLDWLG